LRYNPYLVLIYTRQSSEMAGTFRILLALDLKRRTDRLVAEAERYGKALDAIVHLVHVAEPNPDFVGYLKTEQIDEFSQEDMIRSEKAHEFRSAHDLTQKIGASLKANGVRVGQALTVQGPVLTIILDHARKLEADLLILGAHQHNALYRLWYGDTAIDATKRAPCALLIIPVETDQAA
jgi:nucleotide-binding universal stress UspA family protein